MNIYDVWIDASQKCHLISEMSTTYINRCVGQIRKGADVWRYDSFDELSCSDKKNINVPLQRAWFVVNAYSYLCSFRDELRDRNEDITDVECVIQYIDDARLNY